MLTQFKESVDFILSKTSVKPSVGIVLGTGLGGLVKEISVQEMNFLTSSISLKTGKSLGFRFETNKEAPH